MFEGRSFLPLAPLSYLSPAEPPIPVLLLLLPPPPPPSHPDRPFFFVARRYVSRHELGGSTGGSSNEIVEGRSSACIFNLAVPPPLAFSVCPSLLSPFSGTTYKPAPPQASGSSRRSSFFLFFWTLSLSPALARVLRSAKPSPELTDFSRIKSTFSIAIASTF